MPFNSLSQNAKPNPEGSKGGGKKRRGRNADMEPKEPHGNYEILRPLEVHYSDLVTLSSSSSSSPTSYNENERERLQSVSAGIMEALGPSGPGLISVTGVPNGPPLRHALLPLARKLALLPRHRRASVIKDHGLGGDVPLKNPARTVSSFSLQLKLPCDYQSTLAGSTNEPVFKGHALENELESKLCHKRQDYEFEMLGHTFKELGFCMMELGLHLARICDKMIGSQELEHSILESCSAKGRLIHYHSVFDNYLLSEVTKTKKGSTKEGTLFCPQFPCVPTEIEGGASLCLPNTSYPTEKLIERLAIKPKETRLQQPRISASDLWQKWHYDYGIFTILTTPMFLSSRKAVKTDGKDCSFSVQECCSPNGHTFLQLFNAYKNKIVIVQTEPESFIVQIGESADILSQGTLRSTLHSVARPDGIENISRETFVVFIQPAWGKVLHTSEHFRISELEGKESSIPCVDDNSAYHAENDSTSDTFAHDDSDLLVQNIQKIVPPLSSRLKDGMTFAEFSRETTKQYYGGSGTQSKR